MARIFIATLLTAKVGIGSTMFAPDSDTALLVELLTTTAAQLNELEQLVTNAEKLTGRIQKYNEVVVDHWYRAQRIAFIVDDLKTLSSTKIKNLGDLNSSIRQLKNNIQELEDIIIKYGLIQLESQKVSKAANHNDLQIIKEKMLADIQITRAHKVETVGNIHKVNAQINAYSNKHLTDLKNMSNQQIKLLSIQNEIMAREKEQEAKKELLRREYYNIKQEKISD